MNAPLILPDDGFNRELIENVRPTSWRNPKPAGRYNLVVIGAGTAGLVTAAGAAGLGAKVALVERHLMGGDCLNFGCVPSKALISAARRAAAMRNNEEFGLSAEGLRIDFAKAMERMRRLRGTISRHDSAARFASLGIDVYFGQASFMGGGSVLVEGAELTYRTAVIATGARAAVPPIPGLNEVPYLTNETVFSLTELPRSLAIVGAGPIGCEMAQSFARLGTEVFLLASSRGLLPREDRDAAEIVRRRMIHDGVTIIPSGKNMSVSSTGDGIRLTVEAEQGRSVISTAKLLIATGRAPNVEGLNLEVVGVEYDGKGVRVDDRLRTNNPRIYACGDICSPFQFTHSADFQARIVIQNALFFGRKRFSALTIPWASYTSPEVARVGLNEAEAAERGIAVDCFTQELGEVDRAILDGETEGFVRVLARKGSDEIVGATIVAEHAGDMISEISLAMVHKVGLGGIAAVIHPYPTQAEAIRKVADQYNRTRLTPKVQAVFRKYLAWRRR